MRRSRCRGARRHRGRWFRSRSSTGLRSPARQRAGRSRTAVSESRLRWRARCVRGLSRCRLLARLSRGVHTSAWRFFRLAHSPRPCGACPRAVRLRQSARPSPAAVAWVVVRSPRPSCSSAVRTRAAVVLRTGRPRRTRMTHRWSQTASTLACLTWWGLRGSFFGSRMRRNVRLRYPGAQGDGVPPISPSGPPFSSSCWPSPSGWPARSPFGRAPSSRPPPPGR